MKQSTSFTQVANNLLTVLQGYSKTIRLLLVMFLTLTVSANAWGENYELVSFSNIKTNDVIIIVGTKSGTAYAMKNTGTPPAPIEVTISNSKITSTATDITFTATNNGDNTITFVSTNSGTLYCTNANNGVKIGSKTGNDTKFSFDSDVERLKNIGQTRWLGIYNTQDWRCYNTNDAANIKDTKTTFYRKVTAAPSFTITATSNNNSYGTVSVSGTTITATPKTGYRVSTTNPYTISPSNSAKVTQNGNTFTVTPSANTTITINFEAIPQYTVTWNVNSEVYETTQVTEGSKPIFPATPSSCDATSNTFYGWATATWDGKINDVSAKTIYTSANDMPAVNGAVSYYAVFAKKETSGSGTAGWSKVTSTSDLEVGATYAISSAETAGNYLSTYTGANNFPNSTTIICKLVLGGSADAWTFKINDASSYNNYYLTATSTTGSNYLKATSTIDNYCKFSISFANTGNAVITCTGKQSRNILRYNSTNNPPIFACYSSGQSDVYLQKYSTGSTTTYSDYITTCAAGDPCDALQAPNVTATATANSITLSWEAVDGAISYSVYNYTTEEAEEVNVLTYTFNGLDPETEYEWEVEAVSATCNGKGTQGTTTTSATPCEKLGAATGLTVETDFVQDGQTYVKFSWTPADNTKNYAENQKLCFGKVDEAGTCVDNLAKNQTWTGDLASKLSAGEYWWSIQALGDGVNYCDGDVVNGTNFTIEAPTYTVTFNAGSGTCDDESLTETSGGAGVTLPTANPPAACATDGWTFAGWWTEEVSSTSTSPGTLLNAGDTYNPTSDITLYAVYSTQEAGDAFTGYAKVTTAPDDWSGKYLLSTGTYTANGTYDSNGANGHLVRETYTPGNEEKADWEFTLAKVGNTGYSILFPDGSYYLGYASSTNFARSTTVVLSDNVAYLWSPSTSGITNVGDNTRIIKDGGSDFRPYVNDNPIVYLYKRVGGGSTTIYNSNPTCLVPVWEGATIDKTALTVNCGERSSMDGAAKITFSKDKIFDFSNPITIEASEGFLVSTSRTPNENYQQSVFQSPLVGTEYPNTFNGKFVYVRAEAPAQSDTDLEGTITIKNSKGETLQTITVTADVTCAQYTLTLVDRGVLTEQPTKYYAGETIDEAPADPEGVCTDPIHYVFDGWAAATVAEGSTTYTKVTFPYTVEGNTKFYAVYRYLDDGGEPSNDFIKVTKEKDDWTGDYVIINEDAEKAIGNAYKNTNTLTAVDVTIQDNKVVSPSEAVIWQIRKHGENYTMYNASANNYAYIEKDDSKGAGLSATTTNTTQDIQIVFNNGTAKVSGVDISRCFYYYGTNTEWRTYATGSYNTGALYCRSLESYLYTTSPVCGPHLAITEGKKIYVTGGNAQAARDLVMAQQKVSYKATRLKTQDGSPEGTAPDVKVAINGITKGGVVTTEVKVTFENTVKEQQADDTYTITGDIVVTYEADANNMQEDIQVQLAVDYPANADARDNFTVHARSLPEKFVIVAKQGDKWYALNADMSSSKAQPANGQVTLNDLNNPTKATYAPCNAIYTFEAMPQGAEDRKSVRFIGMENKYLWAAAGTNTGIQNNSTNPAADALAYNWKLYTQDNITYQFGNANSNRQLTLNEEKFGMYASGIQDIRILPYDEKCLYNYAPSNLKVSVLKGTYVTLTWDAVAGATKYQYSTNGTTWTDCGTEPTVTINGLEGNTEYTYYIRADHEDAGVSQECIDYAEITFTTADCDDVPTDITYSADMNSIIVSWIANAATSTVNLYSDEEAEVLVATQSVASPCTFTDLAKNTQYYVQILANGTCASPIIPVKTEDVEVDIVEWDPQGIIVDINTDETVGVTLENEVSYGSGIGTEATELFFSKYYEATGNVKLVAIYNGTKNIIDLTDYEIHYGKDSWEDQYVALKDFGETKGQIQPGEELILYTTQESSDDDKILNCVNEQYPDGKWVRVTQTNNDGGGHLSFAGNKTLVLKKAGQSVDVIGALDSSGKPTSENANAKPSWGDANGWNCATGLSIADDTEIGISTNRCLLIRNNTVTSGDNAVTQNIDDFVTLCSEWKGAHVPDNDIDNGVQASCDNFAYVGTFDYSDYYTKYVPMEGGSTFDENDRNADGTVTIPITDLYKYACSNIRVKLTKLTNSNDEVLTDREYKVPIMITSTQGTNGQTFLDLQQNLATKEVDGEGKVIATHPLSLKEVREICKTCDVVVRDNATLTKVTDGTTNDHPQVHDVIVYEGASIVIPDGEDHNYTINSLALRRKGDEVASAQVKGTGKFVLPADAPVTLSMRIDANNWHWFTLPYDCDIADVTWSDGTPAKYNTDWFLMYYDGESRAASTNPYDNHWKVYSGTTIEAGKGYIIGITGDLAHPNYTFELHFPMEQDVLTAEQTNKTVALNAWGVKSDNTPNNLGWNLVGNPYLDYYQPQTAGFAGLSLLEYTGMDPVTGDRLYDDSGNIPFLVTPIGGGWYEYRQELASDVQMMPFTAYFVQVGDPATHENGEALDASFTPENRAPKSLQARRNASEENNDPAIVAISLTNAKGESDKTTLLIADRFTNEYEMNADFFKWFGDYYTYYTKPVLYTLGADNESRAFNALNEELAAQPVALGMYAAQAGEYTFSLYQRSELSRVEEVWLHDATSNTHTNLMLDNYTFSTSKTDGAGRFSLSVKMKPKIATDIDDIRPGQVWATSQDNEVIVNGLNSGLHLWLYDAVGKLLYAEPTTNYQHRYTVPQDGVYFITVKDVAQVRTIKVVVE